MEESEHIHDESSAEDLLGEDEESEEDSQASDWEEAGKKAKSTLKKVYKSKARAKRTTHQDDS